MIHSRSIAYGLKWDLEVTFPNTYMSLKKLSVLDFTIIISGFKKIFTTLFKQLHFFFFFKKKKG